MMGSPTKSKILAIVPKFTALLSICGSTALIQKILRSPSYRKHTMHRIVLGMSISHVLASIWYFAGTWAIPAESVSRYGDGTEPIFWATGDQYTCSISGFFNQFAISSPLYNATLVWYFLLAIYFEWNDRRLLRYEWLFHAIPVGYALITATFAASTDLYGQVEWTCWIRPDDELLTPIQSRYDLIQWIFFFGVIWACTVFVSVVFFLLHRQMKNIEDKLGSYNHSADSNHTSSGAHTDYTAHERSEARAKTKRIHEKSHQIAIQGQLYVVGFYVIWLFPTITSINCLADFHIFFVQFCDTTLVPLQGFINFCIVTRPRLNNYRKLNPEVGFWSSLATVTFEVKK